MNSALHSISYRTNNWQVTEMHANYLKHRVTKYCQYNNERCHLSPFGHNQTFHGCRFDMSTEWVIRLTIEQCCDVWRFHWWPMRVVDGVLLFKSVSEQCYVWRHEQHIPVSLPATVFRSGQMSFQLKHDNKVRHVRRIMTALKRCIRLRLLWYWCVGKAFIDNCYFEMTVVALKRSNCELKCASDVFVWPMTSTCMIDQLVSQRITSSGPALRGHLYMCSILQEGLMWLGNSRHCYAIDCLLQNLRSPMAYQAMQISSNFEYCLVYGRLQWWKLTWGIQF